MQQVYHPNFENRAVLYASRLLSEQPKKGGKYDMRPVYGIFLMNFNLGHMSPSKLHDVRLMDIETGEIFSNLMRLFFVSLQKAKENWEECEDEYDEITYLIKNMHKMDKESAAYKSKKYEDLFRESEINNMVKEDVVAYSQS